MTTVFLFIFGIGLLVVAYRGYLKGEIRAGSSGLKPYTPTREENPLAFHFFITLYVAGGFSLLVWGILALAGIAEPLPLH
ncbi:MAG TPA: hypothetical protein VF268_12765 [Gammaproteobacteria bacterium]|jgi:hypothetical protein